MSIKPVKAHVLRNLLGAVLFFNVADGIITSFLLNLKIASELNPLMDWVFHKSPIFFILIKCGWVALNLGIIWGLRKSVLTNITWIIFAIFSCLFLYECVFSFLSLVGG